MTPYGSRTRRLPAPPHVVWDDLVRPKVTGTRAWLALEDDEVAPVVLESEQDVRVVWSSLWPVRSEDRVELDLARSGSETALTFVLLAAGTPPDEATVNRIRYRVNRLLWADLRYSYGQ